MPPLSASVYTYVEARYGPLNGRITFNYVGKMYDQRADSATGIFGPNANIPGSPALPQGTYIDSFKTADFTLQYEIMPETMLSLSVINLTNRNPPFARLNYNYDPFTASALGRQFKIGLSTAL